MWPCRRSRWLFADAVKMRLRLGTWTDLLAVVYEIHATIELPVFNC